MGADGAAAGKDVDLKTAPPLEDGEGRGDPEAAAVPCPSEDVGKLTYSVMFLCFYGFMASIRPGESFITPNLLSSEKNFTREQVTNEITPVLTYSYMAVLVPAFLLTDLLRYKPVLIIQGVSHVVIWVLMLLGATLLHMQLMEFFYGITMACRVAYSSYIFSLVSPVLYQRVAGYSRSSVLLGVFVSSVLGQLCLSLGDISYYTLDAISLGFVSFGLALACCLPWPKRSLFFNRTKRQEPAEKAAPSETDEMNPRRAGLSSAARWKESIFVQMLLEVGNMVKRPNLRLWSLWWIFNSTGYYLVLFYVHILWNKVHSTANYNGAVEAAATLLSAITSFMAGFAKIRWNIWSELVIGGITALQAGMLLVMGTTGNIWVCYSCYILFRGFYQFLVPIATFQIASSLTRELCALVFGINTFLGTVLKSIINLIFSDKRGLGLDVTSQFRIYFIYFILLTVVYLISAAVVLVRHFRTQNRGEEEASPDGLHTELTPVSMTSEAEPLSNSQSVKA
ncbi:reduced folate transporter-like [Xiphophorus hellerii]|uniref:reduced folate transporter-like n=1 Tax=Xiphophorus hellerii TaxID=8084 RepID=UPI0013B434E5|nr:reduced folate transporter-like [Xiphophorus hellerii]XP_032412972.1 reduced folate transporter-like [Xiphophorus hellerii]